MKNIIIFHQNMIFGGVEKVTINLLKNLNRYDFKIKLVLISLEGELLKDIPKDIEVISLLSENKIKSKNKVLKILRKTLEIILIKHKLKKIIKTEDIILNMNLRNLRLNIGLAKYKNKKIGWFHSTINSDIQTNLIKFNYKFFKQYSIIYNVSKEGKYDFDKMLPNLKNKSKVLYNSFDVKQIIKESFEILNESEYIVTVGRLVNSHKGFDVLVDAIKKLKDEGISNIKLMIIGDGPDRDILQKQISENILEKNIFIKGFDENPYKWMRRSNAFVLSSNYEGFGLVLVEALACETPIVSTDCKCGPNEILNNGEYGILVPVGDSEALKEGIKKILLNEKLRKELKEKSLKRALDFSNEKIIKQLENQILEL